MRAPNKARGEVALELHGHDLILCAELERVEALEEATGGLNLVALMSALQGRKVSIVRAALECLCIEGDAKAAWSAKPGVGEVPKVADSIVDALVPDDEPGKDAAEAESP